MSPVIIKLEDFILVLMHHNVAVSVDEKGIRVWRGEIKVYFPLEDGFINKRYVHRVSKKFEIEMYYFFHPEVLPPLSGDDLTLQ